ncbi:CapA family protein [Lederbergia wuyishanensis]|uniref:Poly-gamma-glutamate synthesis protein (Capsule biosynthesis protein) n=1 Tax=Lederbergia wuyishanensis TaxID=1347903 RepID=A0ABU0D028_9BACI|nr:CapA family protein [Lederbergia wuyishanensis]MCJ8006392.1 CapA family protein [Lederbergia wuyishanensis]MDQ0341762.1 poly-gamma-glutamate synthesis protein (capsule biosynthesis protein) [Lederbergia wuyishanensis]
MNRKSIIFGVILIIVLLSGIITLFLYQNKQSSETIHKSINTQNQRNIEIEPKGYKTEAVIGGIGDILIHDWVYNDAKTNSGYDFNPMFEPVKSLLQRPDFLIANQESIPGGTEIGITSYPSFNSPHEIVDTLMNAGVDMVTTANNHSLDKGERGILSAIRYYEKKKLPYTGTFKDPEDKANIRIMTVNGIRIAVLAYATHFNGIPIPQGKEYLVSQLDPKQVIKDIEEAKPKSDLVLLAIHWGDEYVRQPNQIQKDQAAEFMNAGADIILGHHPHVLQPMEWFDKPDGKKGLVVYSLGNFLSGQIWDYKDIGGMVEITIKKEVKGNNSITSIEKVNFEPTFSSSINFRTYRLYPLDVAKDKGFTKHSRDEIQKFFYNKK